MPLVVTDKVQEFTKTKEAVGLLRRLRAWSDVQKVNNQKDFDHMIMSRLFDLIILILISIVASQFPVD